jgi:hypothetical protein
MLFPTNFFNEKFLIKIRQCVVDLVDLHPLKVWMKSLNRAKREDETKVKKREFLVEVLNSPFNLITDPNMRKNIVDLLSEIPHQTIPEKILRSYLYLMLGNVARSDNIFLEIINEYPVKYWMGKSEGISFFHEISLKHLEQIFLKLSKHPTDRKAFQLFVLYVRSFFNQDDLLEMVNQYDTNEVESGLNLKSIEISAPLLVKFLKFKSLSQKQKTNFFIKNNVTIKDQLFLMIPFLDVEVTNPDAIYQELLHIEKENELWFIYLMSDENLFNIYANKSGKRFLPGRREFLKKELKSSGSFMMSLYKLIEFGDFGEEIINKVATKISHE